MNELSIIVPCVSTTDTLPQFFDAMAAHLMEHASDIDIIVVAHEDIKSPESIIEYVRRRYPWLQFEMLIRERGMRRYGALVRFGIAHSASRYVVLVSPYGEDDVKIIPHMLQHIRKGVQIVQATRYARLEDAQAVPLRFRLYQVLYRFLTRALLGVTITDSTYGFKMFDRAFIQALGLTQHGYSICPEITLKGLLADGKVTYISSTIRTTPLNKDFKLSREGLGYLLLLMRGVGHRIGVLWF